MQKRQKLTKYIGLQRMHELNTCSLPLIADKIAVASSGVGSAGAVLVVRHPLPPVLARCVTSCAAVSGPLRNGQSELHHRVGVLGLQRVAATR